jgi:hypothetical protein
MWIGIAAGFVLYCTTIRIGLGWYIRTMRELRKENKRLTEQFTEQAQGFEKALNRELK